MFFTRVLRAAPKSKYVLIKVQSSVTEHQFACLRERKEPKKEIIYYDPLIRRSVIYTEIEKLKGIPDADYYPDKNIEIEKVKIEDPYDP